MNKSVCDLKEDIDNWNERNT